MSSFGLSNLFRATPTVTDKRLTVIHPAVHDSALDTIGRHGSLSYTFKREGARTVLTHSACSSPWHYFPPTFLDDSGCAYTWLVNPSGGLVGGDYLTVTAQLQAHTHVMMTSPSANRIYRSEGKSAEQEIRLTVGAGARMEWLPEVTIPFAGSQFRQSIHIDLAPGATVVLWDAMASGRVASGERWMFASYENEIVIRTTAGAAAVERFLVTPDSVGTMVKSWDYVGSLFVVGDSVDLDRLAILESKLDELCGQQPRELLGGVSRPAVPGLVVKVVARSAPALADFLEAAWQNIREILWALPVAALRRY